MSTDLEIGFAGEAADETTPFYLDPRRRARSPELKATIALLTTELVAHEAALSPRDRARKPEDAAKFALAVEVVACNVLAHVLAGAAEPIAVPRSNSALYPPARYRHPALGKHFLTVLKLMARPEVGMLEDLGRGFRISKEFHGLSTVRATYRLTSRIPQKVVTMGWEALQWEMPPDVVVLHGPREPKTGRASPVNYSDTATTRRMRRELQALNARLAAAPIVVRPSKPGDSPIDPTQRSLRRIFNNGARGRWQAGGRLFGGFWETMPKAERFRRITIDGEPIESADYGQLFVWLLYARAGIEPPDGDLYDFGRDSAAQRAAWKVIVNAMLFADGDLIRWPRDALGAFPQGTKLRDLTARVKERHASVANRFGTAEGLKLMHIESCMMVDALARLAAQGVIGLPVHDAVLVRASAAGLAKDAMEASAMELFQLRAKVSVEGIISK